MTTIVQPYQLVPSKFELDCKMFNETYKLGSFKDATREEALLRLQQLKKMLVDEVAEIDEIIYACAPDTYPSSYTQLDLRVELADLLGDLQVYCASEMIRWSLPVQGTLDIIMSSNQSKLGADGLPIMKDGKVQKGPDYWKPEPMIRAMLIAKG